MSVKITSTSTRTLRFAAHNLLRLRPNHTQLSYSTIFTVII